MFVNKTDLIFNYYVYVDYIILMSIVLLADVDAVAFDVHSNNGLLFIHTLFNFTNSQRCEPCHLYEFSQRPSH